MADPREKLVEEICSASSATAACAHRRRSGRTPAFVDWYLVLQLEETAGADVVRRRYRHLALQLHPDKNDHPQAETAFKLVFEAYACLTDEGRRRAFDSDRRRNACLACSGKFRRPSSDGAGEERARRVLQAMREEVRQKLRDDAMVIEHCLRARRLAQESPLFDPSDRLLFPEHRRRRHRTPAEAWFLRPQRVPGCYQSRRAARESPLYEFPPGSSAEHPSFRF